MGRRKTVGELKVGAEIREGIRSWRGNSRDNLSGSFGGFGYCPAVVAIDELRAQEKLENGLGYSVDIPVIELEDKVALVNSLRAQGLDDWQVKVRVGQIEIEVMENVIDVVKGRGDISHEEKVGLLKPYAVALVADRFGVSGRQAKYRVNAHLDLVARTGGDKDDAVRYRDGEIDWAGRTTDVAYQTAFLATQKSILVPLEISKLGEGLDLMFGYIIAKCDLADVSLA